MHIYCIFLFCLFPHIPAYLVLHIAAYFLHIFAILNLHIMAYLPVCIFKHITHMFACKMQIYSYFEKVYLCIFGFAYLYILLHIYIYILAYFSIILLPRPISLMNIQTATCVWRECSFFHLLSLLLFLCFNRPLTPLNVPKVDDLVLGKVVASNVGQYKVQLQQAGDPGFLMPLVLYVLAKPLFCLVVVMMSNFSESAQFEQELSILLLVQRQGTLLIQTIWGRSLRGGSLALTACGWSSVSVFVDCCCCDLDVSLLRLQCNLDSWSATDVRAGDDEDAVFEAEYSSCSSTLSICYAFICIYLQYMQYMQYICIYCNISAYIAMYLHILHILHISHISHRVYCI